tara:strand:+ start:554 stop:2488 length:1935 start_codon:yes stop_codon:yes gene_type:complete
MAKPNFTLPNKPAIKSGSILSYNYTDDFTFVPAPLTFNRDSAATRVNEKGLIEDVGYFGPELVQNGDFSEIGPELVTNGDFSDGSTGWTLSGLNLSISNGKGVSTGSNFGAQFKQTILQTNKIYKLTFDIVDYTSGEIGLTANYYGQANVFNSTGTHTVIFTSLNQTEFRLYSQDFVGSVTNVSVKEVGQNWSFGTGWSVDQANSKAVFDGGADAAIQQLNVVENGKKYKFKIDVNDRTSGNLQIRFGSTSSVDATIGSNGSYVYNFTSDGTTLYLRAISGFNGSITNISVIEVLGDKPRIDYSDSLTEPSLLLEPQSTNLFKESNNVSAISSTKIDNQAISPDGLKNASLYIESTSTASHGAIKSAILPTQASITYTLSVFAKAKERNLLRLNIYADGASNIEDNFDLINGTVPGNDAKIEDYGNGWYRCSMTKTVTNSGGYNFAAAYSGITTNQYYYQGDGKSGLYLYGFQLEQLSYPTSYIPTAGSTVTRLGETANNAGDVNVFNSEEGVLYAEFATISKNYNFATIQLSDGTNNNGVRIFPVGLGTNNIQVQVDSGGSISFVSTSTNNDPTQYNKIAVKYQKDNFSFYINGTQHATDSSGNAPVGLNIFSFLNNFFGKVKDVKVFNKALTDRELEILTIQ